MESEKPNLDAALSLTSAEDRLRMYRDWAASYDAGFAADLDYRLPAHIAGAFMAAGGTGPILDIGAGTGLLAAVLRAQGATADIDGIDLSPDMLAIARAKSLYRTLTLADVTQPLPKPPGGYQGIVSSGTFTHGHVGPEAFGPMLDAAATGALFALSINAGVYTALGFDHALDAHAAQIADLQLIDVPIYGPAALGKAAHAKDRALIALFRKA